MSSKRSASKKELTIADLPEGERNKVSRLVERLVTLGTEHQETVDKYSALEAKSIEDAAYSQQEITILKESHSADISRLNEVLTTLEEQRSDAFHMLSQYQEKMEQMAIVVRKKEADEISGERRIALFANIANLEKIVENQKIMINNFNNEREANEKSNQRNIDILNNNKKNLLLDNNKLKDTIIKNEKRSNAIEMACSRLTKQITEMTRRDNFKSSEISALKSLLISKSTATVIVPAPDLPVPVSAADANANASSILPPRPSTLPWSEGEEMKGSIERNQCQEKEKENSSSMSSSLLSSPPVVGAAVAVDEEKESTTFTQAPSSPLSPSSISKKKSKGTIKNKLHTPPHSPAPALRAITASPQRKLSSALSSSRSEGEDVDVDTTNTSTSASVQLSPNSHVSNASNSLSIGSGRGRQARVLHMVQTSSRKKPVVIPQGQGPTRPSSVAVAVLPITRRSTYSKSVQTSAVKAPKHKNTCISTSTSISTNTNEMTENFNSRSTKDKKQLPSSSSLLSSLTTHSNSRTKMKMSKKSVNTMGGPSQSPARARVGVGAGTSSNNLLPSSRRSRSARSSSNALRQSNDSSNSNNNNNNDSQMEYDFRLLDLITMDD
jgi:hypothetical protein